MITPMSYAHVRKFPYPPLVVRVLRTSAAVWLLARLAYVVVLVVAVYFFGLPSDEGISAALHPTPLSRGVLVAVTAVLVWLDRRRSHEHLLQANFGVSPLWSATASIVAAGVMDVGVHSLTHVL